MHYDLITLSSEPFTQDAVSDAARSWVLAGHGQLLGAWRTEFGELFQIKVLVGFGTREALEEERRRVLFSAQPLGIKAPNVGMKAERYDALPFLPDVEPKSLGGFYEFRTYYLKPGGLAPTIAGWKAAIEPAHDYTQHLVTHLYSLDGVPRVTHIWGFQSLEQRMSLRARHFAEGLWPPSGGPQQIAHATSTICIPEVYSPLC